MTRRGVLPGVVRYARYSPRWHRLLRTAVDHPRGQIHEIPFVTACALRDRGLGTLWFHGDVPRLTISKAGRELLAKWDRDHPLPANVEP